VSDEEAVVEDDSTVDDIEYFDGSNDSELLRRQVHPDKFLPGSRTRLDRAAFTPRYHSDEADGRMSHLRGTVDPEEAWRRYTEEHDRESAGTWPARVGVARDLDLVCGDDSALDGRPEDHAFIELPYAPRGSRRAAALELANWASSNGPLWTRPGWL
jgi:hypothetical protein